MLVRQFNSPAHDLGCQFRIRWEGDVLFLDCGINNDLLFLGLFTVQINRESQYPLRVVCANAIAKMSQLARIAWQSPAHFHFSAEILRVGAFASKLHHLFVAEVPQTFEHEKSLHAPNW
jgi:hypothetical protein